MYILIRVGLSKDYGLVYRCDFEEDLCDSEISGELARERISADTKSGPDRGSKGTGVV